VEDALILRNYSPKTRTAYTKLLRRFVADMEREEQAISVEAARSYLLSIVERGISVGYQGQLAAALRFLCLHVLGDAMATTALPSPRRGRSVPGVLSVEEVGRLIGTLRNPSHKLMVLLMYSSGVRVGELIRLQLRDIDRGRRLLIVRRGKGHKDRNTLLSDAVLSTLDMYLQMRPVTTSAGSIPGSELLFPGRGGERPITARWRHLLLDAGLPRRLGNKMLNRAHASAQFRDAPARAGCGFAIHPGAAGPREQSHDGHLHARDASRDRADPESLGFAAFPVRRGSVTGAPWPSQSHS
jgi:site-specific recombinase XerD